MKHTAALIQYTCRTTQMLFLRMLHEQDKNTVKTYYYDAIKCAVYTINQAVFFVVALSECLIHRVDCTI